MICQKCRTQLADGVRFCLQCGSAQAVTPPPVQPEPPLAYKTISTAKKVGASPRFLIAAILFSLVLVLGLLSLLPAGNALAYEELLESFGFDHLSLPSWLDTLTLVAGIISLLPTVLIVTGLWITFGTCASRKPKANTSGLAIIFVLTLVQMVLSCLALLAALLPTIAFFTRANQTFTHAVLLGMILVILAFFVFMLIYYIQLCTTISNIRTTLKTGVPNKRISRFVAVMCFIGGGIVILEALGSLFSVFAMGFSKELSLALLLSPISALLSGVGQILFGILLFSYRHKMEDLEAQERMNTFRELSYAAPYTSPVYIPPQTETE